MARQRGPNGRFTKQNSQTISPSIGQRTSDGQNVNFADGSQSPFVPEGNMPEAWYPSVEPRINPRNKKSLDEKVQQSAINRKNSQPWKDRQFQKDYNKSEPGFRALHLDAAEAEARTMNLAKDAAKNGHSFGSIFKDAKIGSGFAKGMAAGMVGAIAGSAAMIPLMMASPKGTDPKNPVAHMAAAGVAGGALGMAVHAARHAGSLSEAGMKNSGVAVKAANWLGKIASTKGVGAAVGVAGALAAAATAGSFSMTRNSTY